MLRITDMTLTAVAPFRPSAAQLRPLYSLLDSLGTDYIEMPAGIYEMLRPAESNKIVVRLEAPDGALSYPGVTRFVCRMNGRPSAPGVTVLRELQLNDVKELVFPGQNDALRAVRIVGLDDILCHDFASAFQKLLAQTEGRAEFCPEDSCFCATAAALEWVQAGGTGVAAAFGGLGGKAALEEVLLSLRVVRRHRPTATYDILPQIARLVEDMTGRRFHDRKAVIGRDIFNVESGIHVDGILKKPQMYEPYMPELVGRKRRFVVGKHSGRKSISAKLRELGYCAHEFDVPRLLSAVRDTSVGRTASLTDEEFAQIALGHRL